MKTKEDYIINGTDDYCSPRYSVLIFSEGGCPLNDVEASIASAMQSYADQCCSQKDTEIASLKQKISILQGQIDPLVSNPASLTGAAD